MIILLSSLILFFNFSKKKIIEEKELNHKLKMDFQQEMLKSTINTQEEERSRIARELHDDISSKLNVISLNMGLLKLKLKEPESKQILADISTSLNHSIERSRKISHELMPPVLEKFGLKEAIVDLVSQINYSGIVNVKLEGKENFNSSDGHKKLHIFRIVQELFNNTLKHAGAKHITLSCKDTAGHLEITYEDDGIGIESSDISKGVGMMNIESRMQVLNGHWEHVKVEKGVKYKFKVKND